MDLGWFLGGSGRPLGGHWGSKIEFFRAFIAISIKIRILRHLGVLWGWFWEGLGTVLGGFWQGLGALRALFCFLGVFLGTLRALLGALGQFLVELLFIFVDFYQVLASPIAEASEALWCLLWVSLAYPCLRWRTLALSCVASFAQQWFACCLFFLLLYLASHASTALKRFRSYCCMLPLLSYVFALPVPY